MFLLPLLAVRLLRLRRGKPLLCPDCFTLTTLPLLFVAFLRALLHSPNIPEVFEAQITVEYHSGNTHAVGEGYVHLIVCAPGFASHSLRAL